MSIADLIAHDFVLHWSGIRRKRTLPVIRNPAISLDFAHGNAQLGIGFDQLMDQISTFYNAHSYTVSFSTFGVNRSTPLAQRLD